MQPHDQYEQHEQQWYGDQHDQYEQHDDQQQWHDQYDQDLQQWHDAEQQWHDQHDQYDQSWQDAEQQWLDQHGQHGQYDQYDAAPMGPSAHHGGHKRKRPNQPIKRAGWFDKCQKLCLAVVNGSHEEALELANLYFVPRKDTAWVPEPEPVEPQYVAE